MRVPILVLGLAAFLVSAAVLTPASAANIGIERVRQIAFNYGIVQIEEIEFKRRRNLWEVEGEDARGDDIEMHVDASTGHVLKMERD